MPQLRFDRLRVRPNQACKQGQVLLPGIGMRSGSSCWSVVLQGVLVQSQTTKLQVLNVSSVTDKIHCYSVTAEPESYSGWTEIT